MQKNAKSAKECNESTTQSRNETSYIFTHHIASGEWYHRVAQVSQNPNLSVVFEGRKEGYKDSETSVCASASDKKTLPQCKKKSFLQSRQEYRRNAIMTAIVNIQYITSRPRWIIQNSKS